MKSIKLHSTQRMALVTGMLLALGAVNVLTGRLLAQERGTPADRDPAPPPATPATGQAPSPGRTRTVRMSPEEYQATRSGERMPLRPQPPALRPSTEVAPARLEVTVYEVPVPENRIMELEAPALEAKAATPQDLAKALEAFGKPKVLYKIDQAVNLYGESIMLGTREPMVTGSRRTDVGTTISTITYQQVGLLVNLAATPQPKDAPPKELNVQVNIDLSVLADSGIEIAPQVNATRVRSLQLSHSETPRFGKPWVLLNVSAPPAGDKVPPVAYVVRYVFRELKP
jgi:hypothetical protein